MKKVLLVFASLLIGLTTASARELNNQKTKLEKKKNYRFAQPIIFIERDVKFLIFPDGSFDFNTNINNYNDTYYRQNSRRSNINVSYRGPNSRIQYSANRYPKRGVSIYRDRDGTVRRIGNVYLNYDRYGRIKRAGSIFMKYDKGRRSDLSQVGGLKVDFNKWGEIINTRGQINRYNRECNFEYTRGNRYKSHNNYDEDWYDDDDDGVYNDDYYYFKQNGKVKKHKRKRY